MEQNTLSGRAEPGGAKTQGHSRRKLDLTGQRYGKLTVLGPAENVGGRTAWRCLCDCGRETVTVTQRLRDGRTRSCGCLKPGSLPRPMYIDGTCPEMLAAAMVARKNNTSGVPGVDWRADKARWRASICFKGKRRCLGSYARFEDAVKARKQAEEAYFKTFLEECARASRAAGGRPVP